MKIVVTRHESLIEYLKEIKVIQDGDFQLISHATLEDVEGKDIIGVLPISLASHANTITEIPLNVPMELRGQELSLDQVRKYAGEIAVYKVLKLN